MDRALLEWRLEALTDGDTLRQERLTRHLHDTLEQAAGIAVRFAEADAQPDPGSKGALSGDVALWAAVAAGGQQAARIMVTLIREWSAQERNRRVKITYRGASITISGKPDEAQERLIKEFLDRTDGERGD
ncbi:hypothetical protein [Actinomadura rudentiformis]|uniref:Uncharacterized protein n=1 Tax=Actinomadura rudentiformis TaxID=359158 RepID=A0A6H9YGU5_9ACTN|nr:hypothetical protein [Actinomadura rudentiformis]KAB2339665.1 hypothetical protein F8566_47510 [Actinomadura rudentiformis]